MKRQKGTGSIRQRPDGLWETRLTIAGQPRSFYGRTRRDAVAKLAIHKDEELELGLQYLHTISKADLREFLMWAGGQSDRQLGQLVIEWVKGRENAKA